MDFTTSGFKPLSRGNTVIGNREFKPDPLKEFKTVLNANPGADRFIMSEDGLDVTVASKPFFGVSLSFVFGTSEKETSQNQAILGKFQEALIQRYGNRVTDFAFPDLHRCLLHGAKLDTKTIQRVLKDADLFEGIFSNPTLRQATDHAVISDAEAIASCADFEATSMEYDRLHEAASTATKTKETAAKDVTRYIQKKTAPSDPSPDDQKVHELQALQTLWRAASHDVPENPEANLAIFEQAANETDPNKQDRFVLSRGNQRLNSAPRPTQGWAGAAFQLIAGRDKESITENRRTVEGFRRALTLKYGHTLTNFVFPTAEARHAVGSRLNSATIKNVLEKAAEVSSLLKDASLQNLIMDWKNSIQQEEATASSYREIKLTRAIREQDKNAKLATAEISYTQAEQRIKEHLETQQKDLSPEKIPAAQNARLLHLWFDEAGARYRKAQVESQHLSPVDLLAAIQPSAPPMVIAYPVSNSSSLYGQSGENFKQAPWG